MLKKISHILKICRSLTSLGRQDTNKFFSQDGQIAIILLVIVGILIMMMAVAVNLGRVSMNRVSLQIASDSGSTYLASSVASYAESLYRTIIEPGGNNIYELSVGKLSLDASTIATFAIAAIGALLSATGGLAGPGLLLVSIAGMMMSAAAYQINQTSVHPMMNRMWAKMFENLPYPDQFLNGGVNLALQAAVNDMATVPDISDFDMDGYYCEEGDVTCEHRNNRFAYLNSVIGRLSIEPDPSDLDDITDFGRVLARFSFGVDSGVGLDRKVNILGVYKDGLTSDWGVFDHDGVKAANDASSIGEACRDDHRCNPACIPFGSSSYSSKVNFYASLGGTVECPGLVAEECLLDYPWCKAGNPLYEDPLNSFVSFSELIGRDDDNKFLVGDVGQQVSGEMLSDDDAQFTQQDATTWGTSAANRKMTVYQLLWRMHLADLSKTAQPPSECFWGAPSASIPPNPAVSCQQTGEWEIESIGAFLPPSCGAGSDCFIGRSDPVSSVLTSQLDNFCLDSQAPEYCWGGAGSFSHADCFLWKKGENNFCNKFDPPYHACYVKTCEEDGSCFLPNCLEKDDSPPTCTPYYDCGEYEDDSGNVHNLNNRKHWREDILDHWIRGERGIDGFVIFVYGLLRQPPGTLFKSIGSWFPRWGIFLSSVREWKLFLEQLKTEVENFLQTQYDEDVSLACPQGDNKNLTEIVSCYDDKITAYQTCLHQDSCTVAACTLVKNDLNLRLGTSLTVPADVCDVKPPADYSDFRKTAHFHHEMFRHRRAFLNDFLNAQTTELLNKLFYQNGNALEKITQFLEDNDALFTLITEIHEKVAKGDWANLSSAVYAWKDEDKDGIAGSWHVARVDGRLPTRCGGRCDRGGGLEESDFPVVNRWKVGATQWHGIADVVCRHKCGVNNAPGACGEKKKNRKSFKNADKCFKGGITGIRVTRWDEPEEHSFYWATNVQFWRNLFGRASGLTTPDINQICQREPGFSPDGNAVLVRERGTNCWNHLEELLKQGIQSISCAEYYYRGNQLNISEDAGGGENVVSPTAASTSVFGVRFVDCPEDIFGSLDN